MASWSLSGVGLHPRPNQLICGVRWEGAQLRAVKIVSMNWLAFIVGGQEFSLSVARLESRSPAISCIPFGVISAHLYVRRLQLLSSASLASSALCARPSRWTLWWLVSLQAWS